MPVSISGSGPITGLTSIASPTTLNGLTIPTTGFGKVLQVVRATDATQRTTTSTAYVDASISVTITPQKSDSAILLIWRVSVQSTVGITVYLRISDNSNNAISGAEEQVHAASGTSTGLLTGHTMIGYATPASTSAQTYKGRFKVNNGTGTLNNQEITGQLFAIEVAA